MAKGITLEEAAKALGAFDSRLDSLVKEGMQNGLNLALLVSSTRFFAGGTSRDPFVDPPNSPPGPLKIRSGDLRRGTKVITPRKAGNEFVGGLQNKVKYAAIHEFGGRTGAHFIQARSADVLAFPGRDGNLVFRDTVFHPGSNIPARPFIQPAIEDVVESGDFNQSLGESIARGVEAALGA